MWDISPLEQSAALLAAIAPPARAINFSNSECMAELYRLYVYTSSIILYNMYLASHIVWVQYNTIVFLIITGARNGSQMD